MALVRRKVRGTFLSTDGRRLRGQVTFTPAVTVYDAAGNVVLMKRPIRASTDADGLVEVELPITDDARHTPTGWFYTVTEAFEDGPSRGQYWIEVPEGVGPIPLADAITDQIPPKPDYALIPGPQGPTGTMALGTVGVANPDQNPSITQTGTANAAVVNFVLPRAASVTVEDVTVVNPDQLPTITDVGVSGDVELEFEIPRAPAVSVGTVTTVGPADPAVVTDVGSDGDVVLDFDIPQGVKGDKGDTGLGVPEPVGSDGQIVAATSVGGTEWVTLDTDRVPEAGNLYYTDQRVEDVIAGLSTDDLAEGGNLYYTDARADARAILFAIALGG